MKLNAFYQLSFCTAVLTVSSVVAASAPAPRARIVRGDSKLRDDAEHHRGSIPPSERGDDDDRRRSHGEGGEKAKASGPKPSLIPSAVAPIRHKVVEGETLGEIAQRAGTTVEVLTSINALGKRQPLRVGQLLVLPSVPKSPRSSWHIYARPPKQKGFLDVSTHTSHFSGQALSVDGRLRVETVRSLNNLLGASGAHPALPERLVRLLVEVSDTFGGRPIRLVSGYRTTSYYEDSRHKLSSAIDLMVVGVPNAAVCEYLREIEDVGVGYYPNSSFVHMDVRDHSAYWVDYAGPGEPPRSSPNAPLPHRPSRPMRPAERKLFADLDRALEQTKRGLEKSQSDAPRQAATQTTTTTKPERERRPSSRPTAQAEPASSGAFDELAMSTDQHDAAPDDR